MKEQRSYQDDAYTWQFTSTLRQVRIKDNALWVAMENSYFYPEGGGQPADHGTIDGFPVMDVQWFEDCTWHRLDATPEALTSHPALSLPMGQTLDCKIDAQRRLDLMCQHSGQHVLSAVLSRDYQTATVGFHLTEDNLTIDTDTVLDTATWLNIENQCNQWIRDCISFEAHYPSNDTLHHFELRKQPKVAEGIRLVSLGNLDTVPCGGTHVHHTGALGLIKITRVDKYKAGQRIYFAVGQRAIAQMQREAVAVRALAAKLSAPAEGLEEAADRLGEKLSQALAQTQRLTKQLADLEAQQLIDVLASQKGTPEKTPLIALWDEARDPEGMKALIGALSSHPTYKGAFIVGYKDDKGAQFVLRAPVDGDASKLLAAAKVHFPLRGGGNAQRVQAGGQDTTDVRKAFEWLCAELSR